MIAFVRVTLLRWLRRPLGAGLLAGPLFLSTLFHLLQTSSGASGVDRESYVAVDAVVVLALGSIMISNQLAAMIDEERRLGRLPLLRVGGFDASRAVFSFAIVGLVICVIFGTLGHVAGVLEGLTVGIPIGVWARPITRAPLLLLVTIPAGILAGIALPRVLALILLTLAGLLWGLSAGMALGTGTIQAVAIVIGSLASLVVLVPIWKRFAVR